MKKSKKILLFSITIIAILIIGLIVGIILINNNKQINTDTWEYEVDENGMVTSSDWSSYVDDEHVVMTSETSGYLDNEIEIFFENDVTLEKIQEIVKSINGEIIGNQTLTYQVKIEGMSEEELEELCRNLEKREEIFGALIVTIGSESSLKTFRISEIGGNSGNNSQSLVTPNDPWKDKLQGITGQTWNEENPDGLNWWLETVEVPSAWQYNDRFSNIKIGVVDSGFDTEHEDLKIEVLNADVNSKEDHGTHVAGIIGATANNEKGITGIVWNKELLCVDVKPTSKQKNEVFFKKDDVFCRGIEMVLLEGTKIVNFSMGAEFNNNSEEIYKECTRALKWLHKWKYRLGIKDFLIVEAAGNRNCDSIRSGYFNSISKTDFTRFMEETGASDEYDFSNFSDHIIIVGAIEEKNDKYEIANGYNIKLGSYHTCYGEQISVVAPGKDVFSTTVTGGLNSSYGKITGTSMSAPIVTGVASLVWSINPDFTASEVKDIVCNYTDKTAKGYAKGDNREYPIVNAKLAVEEAIRRTDNTGTLSGIIKEKGTDKALTDISVTVTSKDNSSISKTVKSNKNGAFSLDLPVGKWEISLSSNTHYSNVTSTVTIENGVTTVIQNPFYMQRKDGNVFGSAVDSSTSTPIANVTIEVVDNNSDSLDPITTVTTDENGQFSLNLPYGDYSLSFNHEYYEYYGMSLTVDSDNIVLLDPVYLTRKEKISIDSLKDLLKTKTDKTIVDFFYNDYDSNGVMEAFAIVSDDISGERVGSIYYTNVEVWFVNESNATIVKNDIGYCDISDILKDKKYSFLSFRSHPGRGAVEYIFGVQNNVPKEVNISGKYDSVLAEDDYTYSAYVLDNSQGYYQYLLDRIYIFDDKSFMFIETNNNVSLENLTMLRESHYEGNEGDSRVFNLNKNGLQGNDGRYYRNGNVSLDGKTLNNGFEVWIARWNYGDNISWASATFDLGNKYTKLTGKTDLIKSYNTTNFDTTVYFYNGEKLLSSFRITPANYQQNINVDVKGVKELTILVKDNVKSAGGTSIALYDMFLT